MKFKTPYRLGIPLVAILPFLLASCDVDKVEEGSMPEVKVDVDGEAKLPKYDVNAPEVTIEKKTVEIPTLDVDIPDEEDNEPAPQNN